MSESLRGVATGLLVVLITAPLAFFLFAMGLAVHEAVIWPTATLATATVAGLAASWLTDTLTRDSKRTYVNQVVTRSLLWGSIPAALITLATLAGMIPIVVAWVVLIVVIYTSVVGVLLATHNRTEQIPYPPRGRNTVFWLIGSTAVVFLVIRIASLFGLTGA